MIKSNSRFAAMPRSSVGYWLSDHGCLWSLSAAVHVCEAGVLTRTVYTYRNLLEHPGRWPDSEGEGSFGPDWRPAFRVWSNQNSHGRTAQACLRAQAMQRVCTERVKKSTKTKRERCERSRSVCFHRVGQQEALQRLSSRHTSVSEFKEDAWDTSGVILLIIRLSCPTISLADHLKVLRDTKRNALCSAESYGECESRRS